MKNKAFRGYEVLVGDKKGGIFWLTTKKSSALKWGRDMLKTMKPYMKKGTRIIIKKVMLKKCDMEFCKEFTFADERYCLGCDNLLLEAQQERYNEIDNDD